MKTIVEGFIQTLQRHTALNPEISKRRNLDFYLSWNGSLVPDIKKHTEGDIVG